MDESTKLLSRLAARSVEKHGCWEWTGALGKDGYGLITTGSRATGNRRVRPVHRVAYEAAVTLIPDGLQLDHLCRNRKCWNPQHLDPVPPKVNTHRGLGPAALNVLKTHCPKGHPYDDINTHVWNGHRTCRTCARERAGSVNVDQALRTHCPHGHPYDEANTYVVPKSGHRQCRTCNRRRWKETQRKRSSASKKSGE